MDEFGAIRRVDSEVWKIVLPDYGYRVVLIARLDVIKVVENGPSSGSGKLRLGAALGHALVENAYRVLFTSRPPSRGVCSMLMWA